MAIKIVERTEYVCTLCGYIHHEPIEHCHICNDGKPHIWTTGVKPPTDSEIDKIRRKLQEALICPVCGLPKVHSRLHGYHCVNEEHN